MMVSNASSYIWKKGGAELLFRVERQFADEPVLGAKPFGLTLT